MKKLKKLGAVLALAAVATFGVVSISTAASACGDIQEFGVNASGKILQFAVC